jgi:hypothetical protein
MRWLFRATIALMALCVAFVLAYLFLPPIGRPSAKTLAYDVARQLNADVGSSTCQRHERSRYRCSASDGSGSTEYRVTLHGHCWKAVRVAGSEALFKQRDHGCLHWRDQLRLFGRFLDAT